MIYIEKVGLSGIANRPLAELALQDGGYQFTSTFYTKVGSIDIVIWAKWSQEELHGVAEFERAILFRQQVPVFGPDQVQVFSKEYRPVKLETMIRRTPKADGLVLVEFSFTPYLDGEQIGDAWHKFWIRKGEEE